MGSHYKKGATVMNEQMRGHKKIFLTFLLCISLLCWAGCAVFNGSYGRLMINDEVRAHFESFNVGGYVYYISGTDVEPRAIVGVDKNEPFDQGLWKQRSFTRDTLEESVRNMQVKASSVGLRLYGFDITDSTGKKVGIWYSVQDSTSAISRDKEGRLVVTTPPLDVYDRAPRWKTFSY